MCDKCEQLENDIQRYHKLIERGLDPLTLKRIKGFICELEQRKEAMHSRLSVLAPTLSG